MAPVEFTLTDAQDQPHEYTVNPHNASDGTALCVEIMGAAGEPIGRLLSSNLDVLLEVLPKAIASAQNADDDEEIMADLEAELGDQVDDLDLDLSQAVRDIKVAVVEAGGAEFFRRLFKHAYRDGDGLAKKAVYDSAFQANYGELFKAAWKIVQVNGFLLLLRTL